LFPRPCLVFYVNTYVCARVPDRARFSGAVSHAERPARLKDASRAFNQEYNSWIIYAARLRRSCEPPPARALRVGEAGYLKPKNSA
jgi:hypothetical protein